MDLDVNFAAVWISLYLCITSFPVTSQKVPDSHSGLRTSAIKRSEGGSDESDSNQEHLTLMVQKSQNLETVSDVRDGNELAWLPPLTGDGDSEGLYHNNDNRKDDKINNYEDIRTGTRVGDLNKDEIDRVKFGNLPSVTSSVDGSGTSSSSKSLQPKSRSDNEARTRPRSRPTSVQPFPDSGQTPGHNDETIRRESLSKPRHKARQLSVRAKQGHSQNGSLRPAVFVNSPAPAFSEKLEGNRGHLANGPVPPGSYRPSLKGSGKEAVSLAEIASSNALRHKTVSRRYLHSSKGGGIITNSLSRDRQIKRWRTGKPDKRRWPRKNSVYFNSSPAKSGQKISEHSVDFSESTGQIIVERQSRVKHVEDERKPTDVDRPFIAIRKGVKTGRRNFSENELSHGISWRETHAGRVADVTSVVVDQKPEKTFDAVTAEDSGKDSTSKHLVRKENSEHSDDNSFLSNSDHDVNHMRIVKMQDGKTILSSQDRQQVQQNLRVLKDEAETDVKKLPVIVPSVRERDVEIASQTGIDEGEKLARRVISRGSEWVNARPTEETLTRADREKIHRRLGSLKDQLDLYSKHRVIATSPGKEKASRIETKIFRSDRDRMMKTKRERADDVGTWRNLLNTAGITKEGGKASQDAILFKDWPTHGRMHIKMTERSARAEERDRKAFGSFLDVRYDKGAEKVVKNENGGAKNMRVRNGVGVGDGVENEELSDELQNVILQIADDSLREEGGKEEFKREEEQKEELESRTDKEEEITEDSPEKNGGREEFEAGDEYKEVQGKTGKEKEIVDDKLETDGGSEKTEGKRGESGVWGWTEKEIAEDSLEKQGKDEEFEGKENQEEIGGTTDKEKSHDGVEIANRSGETIAQSTNDLKIELSEESYGIPNGAENGDELARVDKGEFKTTIDTASMINEVNSRNDAHNWQNDKKVQSLNNAQGETPKTLPRLSEKNENKWGDERRQTSRLQNEQGNPEVKSVTMVTDNNHKSGIRLGLPGLGDGHNKDIFTGKGQLSTSDVHDQAVLSSGYKLETHIETGLFSRDGLLDWDISAKRMSDKEGVYSGQGHGANWVNSGREDERPLRKQRSRTNMDENDVAEFDWLSEELEKSNENIEENLESTQNKEEISSQSGKEFQTHSYLSEDEDDNFEDVTDDNANDIDEENQALLHRQRRGVTLAFKPPIPTSPTSSASFSPSSSRSVFPSPPATLSSSSSSTAAGRSTSSSTSSSSSDTTDQDDVTFKRQKRPSSSPSASPASSSAASSPWSLTPTPTLSSSSSSTALLCQPATPNQSPSDSGVSESGPSSHPTKPTVKIGIILAYEGRMPWVINKTQPAIELATEKVKLPNGSLPGYDIQIVIRDSRCSETFGALEGIDLYVKNLAHVFIGPSCDYSIAPLARMSPHWGRGIPILTGGALVAAFEDKMEYRQLTRIQGSYTKSAEFILSIITTHEWSKVCVVLDERKFNGRNTPTICKFTIDPIFVLLERRLEVPYPISFDQRIATNDTFVRILKEINKNCRIIVLCASSSTVREIMIKAHELNFDNGEYVFFNIDLFSSKNTSETPWYRDNDTDERNAKARKAYESLMTVTLRMPTSTEYRQFSDDVKARALDMFPNFTYGEDEVNSFVGAFHDAVLLYALALNETLAENGSISDGEAITRRMWNRTFAGITGNVSIDANGDRNADYSLLDLNPETNKFEVVANYFGNKRRYEPVPGKTIHWAGGRQGPPPDTPKCGFDGSKCPPDEPFPEYGIVIIVLGSILVIVLIAIIFIYRHVKLEAELAEMNWRVRWDDILFGPPEKNKKLERQGSRLSLRKGSLPSECSGDTIAVHLNDASNRQLFTRTGYYKGAIIAIKPITGTNITISKPMLLEIKRMKDLQNDHIVRFIGACIDFPNQCILTEYCPKGSLQDVLENDQIKLDWMFRYSIMQDIVRGMAYLQGTEVRSHGYLKSTNCVVDSRFVVKITDFGLHHLRGSVRPTEEDEISYSYFHNKLWTAPELLRMAYRPPEGTIKGDVYSFAIICQEIVYRNGVFYLQNLDLAPQEIYQKVKTGLKPYFRPTLEEYDCPCDELAGVIRRCWAEDPADRPDFQALKSIIRKLNRSGDKGNILDNLLSRMEQYANNLEALVEERTADYLQQKKKAEDLLYNMLPKKVASQLIRGESVTAEWYDFVSIYFSDICGFTALSAESTPMEVVDLLNDLYTTFDSIIENFDVYKVETIGDAYMVVSGLPDRNGSLHAREIARMSLSLLKATLTFRIRHRPTDQLKIRIGIHTGSVCAGVVGLKMPRYCLFGDTVNTASRMESNGLPLKIHVSPQCKEVLDTFGSFDLELRGNVEMKGKGLVKTYWLQGEKNVSDSPGVSLNIL